MIHSFNYMLNVYEEKILIKKANCKETTKTIYYTQTDNTIIYIQPELVAENVTNNYIIFPVKDSMIKLIKKENELLRYLLFKKPGFVTYCLYATSHTNTREPALLNILNKDKKAAIRITETTRSPSYSKSRGIIVTLNENEPLMVEKNTEKYIITPNSEETKYMDFDPYEIRD